MSATQGINVETPDLLNALGCTSTDDVIGYLEGRIGAFGAPVPLVPGVVVLRDGDDVRVMTTLVLDAPEREVNPSALSVSALGSLQICSDGPVSVGGPNQRRILAALAMRRGGVVSVDRLVDITWTGPEVPPRARRNVRTYVSRIRAALGADSGARLVTRPTGYALELDVGQFDVGRFEQAVGRALEALGRDALNEAVGSADEALGLWRGRPYGEFAEESWAQPEVARLEELRLSAIECRAEALLALGRGAEALSTLAAVIEEYPLREGPRRLQMLGLYWSRRHVDALRAFQTYRDLLIEEVGLGPSDDLVELDRAIAADDESVCRQASLRLIEGGRAA